MSRPQISDTFIDLAYVWSKRGTCAKRKVGAVIVDAKGYQLSSGYNGQPRGEAHCTIDAPCPAFTNPDLSCNAIHAEVNALINCPKIDKAFAIYVTTKPCDKCMLSIRNSPIEYVYYSDEASFHGYIMEKIK